MPFDAARMLEGPFDEIVLRAGARRNLGTAALVEQALARGEARLSAGGCLAADTGQHTGRSPKDKFIVRDAATQGEVWWDNTGAMTPARFDRLLADMLWHAGHGEPFVQDLEACAEPAQRIRVRVVTELAWHQLFIRNLLIRPERPSSAAPDLMILDCPSFRADPARHGCRSETVIALDLARGIVLIGGTAYAGEIKKAVFSYLNYHLPGRGVLPMHGSANVGSHGDVAVFFGLSGTGKTTLSADPHRALIGDDEHGWGEDGVFNIEGGCYAKAVDLTASSEPEIFATSRRFGTVMENVVLDPGTGEPDFADRSRTENTRLAYPVEAIPGAVPDGRAGQPGAVVMLTCDAFGVLPPLARLTPDQAVYHFLSGYTAKVAGTERGVVEPQATFSTCFAAPFLPRHPSVYAAMLRERIEEGGVPVWLLNTGWTGGGPGTGARMPLAVTRRLLAAALDGSLEGAAFRTDPCFGLAIPTEVPGVEAGLLDPAATWADRAAYEAAATRLVGLFEANIRRFDGIAPDVLAAGPRAAVAA